MDALTHFCRKYELVIFCALIALVSAWMSVGIQRPLVDYDEATYAQIASDTLKSASQFDKRY